MKAHDKLIQDAVQAIERLFSDTSVTQGRTADDLRDLISDIEGKIESMGLKL